MSAGTVASVRRGLTSIERDLVPVDAGFLAYWGASAVARRRMVRAARATMREFRAGFGYADARPLLTDPDAQPKLGKSATRTPSLMLTPARSILGNACPQASAGCGGDAHRDGGCLNSAGKGKWYGVQYARLVRMAFMCTWPWEAGVVLAAELAAERAKDADVTLGFRPNCVSDIRWELVAPGMLAALHASGFVVYDYTAWAPRFRADAPEFYRLTYSAKETHSLEWVRGMLAVGHNVAVPVRVRRGGALPDTWHGMPAIDGDVTDWRPGDPSAVVVLLRCKGDTFGDTSGFIRDLS